MKTLQEIENGLTAKDFLEVLKKLLDKQLDGFVHTEYLKQFMDAYWKHYDEKGGVGKIVMDLKTWDDFRKATRNDPNVEIESKATNLKKGLMGTWDKIPIFISSLCEGLVFHTEKD